MGIRRLYCGCLLACVFCFHFHHDVRDILPICVLQIVLINSTKIYNILFISMTRIKIHSFWKISGMKEWFIFSMMLFSTTYIERENVYPLTTFPQVYHPLVPRNNAFTEWDILLLMKIDSIHLCVSGLMHVAQYLPGYTLSSISGSSFYGYKYQKYNALCTCFFWTFRFFAYSYIMWQMIWWTWKCLFLFKLLPLKFHQEADI